MKFETLKGESQKKKIIIGVIIFSLIVAALIITISLAKYNVTQSLPIAKGTINYSPSDLTIMGIFIGDGTDYSQTDTVPDSGYTFNSTNSYCEKGGEKLTDVVVGYDMENKSLSLSNFTQKGIKCYLYFDEKPMAIEILATIDGASSSTFPTKSSDYTPNSVTCTNDATAKFDFVDWAVEVDSQETTCTVNFEQNKNTSFADYLKNKVCSSTPTSDDAAKDCLVNENGYRYEGSDPNNYVLFNDELWRIIGVFTVTNSAGTSEDLVKLIRDDTLDGLAWHGSNTNDWTAATLQTQLNNGYLNAIDTTCNGYSTTVTKTCKFSETGLNSTARNMAESVVWNLGGMSNSSSDVNYYKSAVDTWYTYERGETVYSGRYTTLTGKVALMYPSDYGYAVLASSCARTTLLSSYNTTACAGNNWLYKDGYQWTLTPNSSYSVYVFYVDSNGRLISDDAVIGFGARPSIYLKSSINILGGTGTRNMPYIIE